MRLIDADAMYAEWLGDGENEYVYDTNAVLESIDSQPTVESPQWIPVTERLPKLIPCEKAGTAYSEAVIVWTTGKKAMIAVWDGIDFLCAADYWEAWGETITHWMPLPQAPKEGERT